MGAGASAAGGVPTGYDMILDFKSRLFSASQGITRHDIDVTDPIWNERITSYYDSSHGFPPDGDPAEYAVAFETVFPEVEDRRAYISECVSRSTPTFGHRLLAALVASGKLPCMFTTNFDRLIETSVAIASELREGGTRSELAIATSADSADVATRCVRESDWPLLVKLHGDYKSTHLRNTKAELQRQDESLRRVLINLANRFGLVVVGYSGRDDSVMAALTESLMGPSPFPTGIRWVIQSGLDPLDAVVEFLDIARSKAIDARLVESETFDELAADISDQIELPRWLTSHVLQARPEPILQPVDLSQRVEASEFPVLRCSALPILEIPQTARILRLDRAVGVEEVRKVRKRSRVRAVFAVRNCEVTAFGSDEDLQQVFAEWGVQFAGEQTLDLQADSWAVGLIYEALVMSLTRARPLRPILRHSGHAVVVAQTNARLSAEIHERDKKLLNPLQRAYRGKLMGLVPESRLPFAEGVRIRLEVHDGRWWCVFDPFTWVKHPARVADTEQTDRVHVGRWAPNPTVDWRRERWATRYNPAWASILDAWSRLLVPESESTLHAVGLFGRSGVDASFKFSAITAWCRPAHSEQVH